MMRMGQSVIHVTSTHHLCSHNPVQGASYCIRSAQTTASRKVLPGSLATPHRNVQQVPSPTIERCPKGTTHKHTPHKDAPTPLPPVGELMTTAKEQCLFQQNGTRVEALLPTKVSPWQGFESMWEHPPAGYVPLGRRGEAAGTA